MTDLFTNELALFPTSYNEIVQRIGNIDPVKYGTTRNFIDGSVTHLSPYISRGVVSTKQILAQVLNRGYKPYSIEKFIQELAWRDYWQQIWIAKGDAVNNDLKNEQTPVSNSKISKAIVNATTGIAAIDEAITIFYQTGYLHNHVRMYVASIVCNIAQNHWKLPAQWMYYHLLDADWASNTLSWQWVAGTNSHKKYYANQDNINKYCYSQQKNTFLDISYKDFEKLSIPKILEETLVPELKTPLTKNSSITINHNLPTFVYNFYNLDPLWKKEIPANRILLLSPSVFKAYPVSQKTIDFMIALSKNIEDIQVYVGEFDELTNSYDLETIYYKEHPLNIDYKGIEEPRDWMFTIKGYYPSFFSFWKKCKKELAY